MLNQLQSSYQSSRSAVGLGATTFKRDEGGAVALIFGLMSLVLFMVVGLAIDGGRAYHARTKLTSAIDAAALAGARGMREANLTDSEVRDIAQKYFDNNMTEASFVTISSFTVNVDRDNSSVQVDAVGIVPATFAHIAGIAQFDIPATTLAMYESKDIELSLSLDMTGSMSGQKTADLRDATMDLLDIMMPDAGTNNKVRIAFAPFAASVNAGGLAAGVTNNRSLDGCVYERDGADKTTDAAPGGSAFLKVAGDTDVTSTLNHCPGIAVVVPLSDDKSTLQTAVGNFEATGSTAGHLGTAWAWYLLSPEWASILPGASTPAAYSAPKTIKAVILMTDGKYNTYGGRGEWDVPGNANKSEDDAGELCTNMRGKKVVVYTIGFQIDNPSAEAVLRNCASSPLHFFQAENGDELRASFRAIAIELNSLRLAK